VVVVSIFVNPTQFNNPGDLKNYPRTPEEDFRMLEINDVNVLFSPSESEMYDKSSPEGQRVNLGELEKVMEGEHRPGHFAGVVQIVSKLFEIIHPHKAYFGEKDFQQLAIIRLMVARLKMEVSIVPCPTVREESGLAMSSRNLRLSDEGRKEAAAIYSALKEAHHEWKNYTPAGLKKIVIDQIQVNPQLKVEYVEIADEETLQPVNNWSGRHQARIFAAVFCEGVRLIDNVKLF
jgi:pantoate--beta-alanine ligase